MSKGKPSDMAASVRQQLLNLSRERGEDFQLVLTWYGLERLLYRLGRLNKVKASGFSHASYYRSCSR